MGLKLNKKKVEFELQRLGWSIEDLANRMKVRRTYVYHYFSKKANPTLATIEKFAKALSLDPKDLII